MKSRQGTAKSLGAGDGDILQVFAGQNLENEPEIFVDQNQESINQFNGEGDCEKPSISKSQCLTPSFDIMQMFSKTQELPQADEDDFSISFDPRSLFNNSPKRVPQNSDAESDD